MTFFKNIFLFSAMVLALQLTAQQPELVADINTSPLQSLPSSHAMSVAGGKVFFSVEKNGTELGVHDGSTFEYFDLNPSGSSSPSGFTEAGGAVYFSAVEPGADGEELYQYQDGDVTMIDINPAGSSNPENLTEFGGNIYFSAEDGTSGIELWKYDGTSATVIDIQTGSGSSEPEHFISHDGELLFFADDGMVGNELWKYDGTSVSLAGDIRPGAVGSLGSANPYYAVLDGSLYFTASDGSGNELWKYDGTTVSLAAEINASGSSNPKFTTPFNGKLYFRAYGSDSEGDELWQYDGTTASLVSDLNPGTGSSLVQDIIATSNFLYFVATDGTNGADLYKYDGSSLTHLDVNPDNEDLDGRSFIDYITAVGNTIYFQGYGGAAFDSQLWKYDGTTLTQIIIRSDDGASPRHMSELNGDVYFTAVDGDGTEGWQLWKYDGSEPSPVVTINVTDDSNPYELTLDGDKAYFVATTNQINDDLFVWDGSTTQKVSDIATQPVGTEFYELTAFDGKLVYVAYFDESGKSDLQVFDGTDVELVDIRTEGDANPDELTLFNETLYFYARNDDGYQIFKYDGTSVTLAYDLVADGIGQARDFIALGDHIYFTAEEASVGREIFKFDGTTVTLLGDLNTSGSTNVSEMTIVGETIYFAANTPQGTELCKYNGTSIEIIDIVSGPGSSSPLELTPFGSSIVFKANDGVNGSELWVYDGENATLYNIYDGAEGSNLGDLTEFNDVLYFRAANAETGRELFQFDGTEVSLVADIKEGSGHSFPGDFFVHGPYMYFNAYAAESEPARSDSDIPNEDGLWRYDGTNLEFVSDFYFDGDTYPVQFSENYAFMTGSTDETGTEIYRLRAISEEAEIVSFALESQTSDATLDSENGTINIEVEAGTNVTSLAPLIEVSNHATIDLSGPQDFGEPVVYTVTSEFGNSIEWTVYVTIADPVVPQPLGINEAHLIIYPNPSSDFIHIESKESVSATLVDLNGKRLLTKNGNQLTLDIHLLKTGIYILQVREGGHTSNYRIIKAN